MGGGEREGGGGREEGRDGRKGGGAGFEHALPGRRASLSPLPPLARAPRCPVPRLALHRACTTGPTLQPRGRGGNGLGASGAGGGEEEEALLPFGGRRSRKRRRGRSCAPLALLSARPVPPPPPAPRIPPHTRPGEGAYSPGLRPGRSRQGGRGRRGARAMWLHRPLDAAPRGPSPLSLHQPSPFSGTHSRVPPRRVGLDDGLLLGLRLLLLLLLHRRGRGIVRFGFGRGDLLGRRGRSRGGGAHGFGLRREKIERRECVVCACSPQNPRPPGSPGRVAVRGTPLKQGKRLRSGGCGARVRGERATRDSRGRMARVSTRLGAPAAPHF